MNGKKWIVTAVIAVIVLFLVAAALAAVVVVRTANDLDDMWSDSRYDQWEDEEDEEEEEEEEERPARRDEDEAVVEAPAEEIPAVEEPAEMYPAGNYCLGMVLMETGEFSGRTGDAFCRLCEEYGYSIQIVTATSGDPAEAFEIAMTMMYSGVDALAVNCPEPDLMNELVMVSMEMGIPLVSLDLQQDFYPEMAMLHVNGWGSPWDIGVQLLYTMGEETDYTGKFGVVAPLANDPVVDVMESIIGNGDFKNVVWKASDSGKGDFQSCVDSVSYMLSRNTLDAIICTDPQTTLAAAQVITESGYDVKLIGYGVPSQLTAYMPDGVVFYQDPESMGQTAFMALLGILDGTLVLEEGNVLETPNGFGHQIYLTDGVLEVNVDLLYITKENVGDYAAWY